MKTDRSFITRRQFLKASAAALAGGVFSRLVQPLDRAPRSAAPKAGSGILAYLPFIGKTPLQVGPTRVLKVPSAAAAAAEDSDVIEIDAGDYHGDTAIWTQNNLTLRGAGGKAHLLADGQSADGKAIWVIQGNNTTVEDIEFSGAAVSDKNGAGIRQEGENLTVRSCFFHDNENGILAGDYPSSDILIEFTEFGYNGFGDGYTHNLYINHVRKFTLQYCYSHHARVGHLVKSRALENHILYNRIMDEALGTSSYSIDLPNGGLSYVIGNLVQQGPNTENSTIITYAEEGATNPTQEIYLVNNTIANDRLQGGTFIRVAGLPAGFAVNNLLVGGGTDISGTLAADHNLQPSENPLVDRASYNYHLVAGSEAVDAGRDPGSANGVSLVPVWEYMHPTSRVARVIEGIIDAGAYEFHL